MSCQSNLYLGKAEPEDGPAISAFMHNSSFEGDIAVQYLREPDALASYAQEGAQAVFVLLRENGAQGRVIGTGGCVIREAYIGSQKRHIGYLTGMRIVPEYQKRLRYIPRAYDLLHQLTHDRVDGYITTILEDNHEVQQMLTKPHRFMPCYQEAGQYRTYFCKTGRHRKRVLEPYRFSTIGLAEAVQFYESRVQKGEFALIHANQYGLQRAQFFGLYQACNLRAIGYTLNQQAYKQYVVQHYKGGYRALSHAPVWLLGYPPFPKPKTTANCAAAGFWVGKGVKNPEQVASILWDAICAEAGEFDFLMLGLHVSDWRSRILDKKKKITYLSRLYQVYWPEDGAALPLGQSAPWIEVAFL